MHKAKCNTGRLIFKKNAVYKNVTDTKIFKKGRTEYRKSFNYLVNQKKIHLRKGK